MACARAVTTTLAMLCTLAASEVSGQLESPHRPQLQELQQLTRLLENELQQYESQNNQQQPWWAQQNQYVPLGTHLQDQANVLLVPGQQQLANLEKQLEQNIQDGQFGQFGQRIKQRPQPQAFQPQLPQPPRQQIVFTPFKPLPEPFRHQPWQPVQQPQTLQNPLIQQQPHIQQQQSPIRQQQPQIQLQPTLVIQHPSPIQPPVTPFQQPSRPPAPVPLNLQQQPDVLDLSQLKQLVQLQQDLDQQREKHIRQRQQEQSLNQQQSQQEQIRQQQRPQVQQQQNPVQQFQQQRQPPQQQQPSRTRTPQQQRQQQQQRQTNQIPSTNKEKQKPSNTTEKPIKTVRDLFNTTSCVEPPFTCPHPRIQFYLYTRSTQDSPIVLDVLDPKSLQSSGFDPSLPIKVLIHGFQGGRNFSPSTDLRKAYFTRGGYNVIVVEYGSLVRVPCLNQVQWSPSFLAMCISQLVSYIGETSGIPPERFHLIGYSIGAHVAGLVANYVGDRRLGRITGLDPTIIFYQGSNKSHDLDPTDARFVDVIHTGAGILGQRGPNGHVDYYVNGGTTQPGCQSDSIIKTLSCDHTKVSPYYVESIVTPSGFWALPCPNYFMYLLGLCQPEDKDYILMGEDAPLNARGIYYVTTNANKPYAKGWPGKGPKPKLPGRSF